MAKENQKTTEQKTKTVSKKGKTIASVAQEVLGRGVKNREAGAKEILNVLKERGVLRTRKNLITEGLVMRQISAMSRDIQKDRQGWWSKLEVVEDKLSFKWVPK